jgi:hypothetical protein
MCVFLKLVFHVTNNSDNDINILRCIGDAVSNSGWFLKVHKAWRYLKHPVCELVRFHALQKVTRGVFCNQVVDDWST